MRIKYGSYKLRGYYKMADLALKYLNMTKPAKTKLDILTFFNKHGLSATKDAYSISRSSLYRWKLLYHNYGINGLEEKRTCPHNTRKRHWDYRIVEEFVNYNTQDLINPKIFNHKLSDWLYWYNCERDHHSLGYNTPMEFMKKDFESQVIWGHTDPTYCPTKC